MKIAIIGSGSRSTELPPHLSAQIPEQDVQLELITPRLSLFASTPYERLLVDVGYVDACQQAKAQGADAVIINSFADYGLAAARAVLDIPVYGAGEAAIEAAIAHGAPFGIVTVWPHSMGFLYTERLRSLACEALCCEVRHVQGEDELQLLGSELGVMARMARHEEDVMLLLSKHCDDLIARGARSLVLGCTCMGPIAASLDNICGVPIIEGSVAALKTAMQGQRQPLAKTERTRRPDLIPTLVSAWPGRQDVMTDGDCPVCIVTENEA
jgi:allantoin racemase